MKVGRKIYYDNRTGNVLIDTGEMQGNVKSTTIAQDIEAYSILSQLNRDAFEVLELSYGKWSEDFLNASGYRVNLETRELEFSYDPPSEIPEETIYRTPLSEKIDELEATFMYDSMMKDLAIVESNAIQADLIYQLMQKGVL